MPQLPPEPTSVPAPSSTHIIWLHPSAPAKPAVGVACNGCGMCCAAEPCPLGVLLTRRRRGQCRALQWDDTAGHYRCAMLTRPEAVLGWRTPWAVWMARRILQRLARRWIAAGTGCDADWEPQPPQA